MASEPQFAGVIVVTTDGQVALQVRDDKPGVSDPGKLSVFAGRIEGDETPEQAARRELLEETTVDASDLTFYRVFAKDPARHGAPGTCNMFVARGVDSASIKIQEGSGYKLIRGLEDISEDNCALISYDILRAYFTDFLS